MIHRSKLARCRELREEAARYEEMLLERQPSISSKLDAMPRGTQIGRPTEETAIDLISIEDLMYNVVQEHKMLTAEIATVCAELESTKRQIILLRYIDGLSWEEVGAKLGYSIPWIMELHRRAVEQISYI